MKNNRLYKLKALLLESDRKRLLRLLLPMSLAALMNIFGIAFIMPFVAVVANPGLVNQSKTIGMLYHFFHFSQPMHFTIFLGALALVMLVLADSISALTTWLSSKAVGQIRARIVYTLYQRYLAKPYEYHLNNNSATLSNNLFTQVPLFVEGYILQGTKALASGLSIAAILALVVFLNPMMALMTAIVLGGVYVLIYLTVKKTLRKNSETLVRSHDASYRLVGESLGGIKDIKLHGSEGVFTKLLLPSLNNLARCFSATACISTLPKYILEVIAFGGIIVLMLGMIISGMSTTSIIPIISALCVCRVPFNASHAASVFKRQHLKSSSASLDAIYDSVTSDEKPASKDSTKTIEKIKFEDQFRIKDLSYHYTGFDKLVLKNIDIHVKHNEIIGVIGSTGAGKTTLIDIILGLLQPTAGMLSVDNVDLDSPEKIAAWQKGMGYVPQFIYLSDNSIKENIAFGVEANLVDIERVKVAAKIAAIHDFVSGELENGYDTIVGERGVKLSGGQIQRIGIARALYRNPSILVLDEATSSLDSQTEAVVMQAIYNMKDKITIIIIAHRLSTVACCDKVFLMQKGQIIDEGRFSELAARHDSLNQQAVEVAVQ